MLSRVNDKTDYLSCSHQLVHRAISSHCERIRERGSLSLIDRVRNARNILLNPLRIIVNRMIIAQDLISISVVVHGDGSVWANKFTLESDSLFGSPIAVRRKGVEHDGILGATNRDVEKVVAGVEEVNGGVVDCVGAGFGGVEV